MRVSYSFLSGAAMVVCAFNINACGSDGDIRKYPGPCSIESKQGDVNLKTDYTYDEENRRVVSERKRFDSDGMLVSHTGYTCLYDESDRATFAEISDAIFEDIIDEIQFSYEDDGLLIARRLSDGDVAELEVVNFGTEWLDCVDWLIAETYRYRNGVACPVHCDHKGLVKEEGETEVLEYAFNGEEYLELHSVRTLRCTYEDGSLTEEELLPSVQYKFMFDYKCW